MLTLPIRNLFQIDCEILLKIKHKNRKDLIGCQRQRLLDKKNYEHENVISQSNEIN